MGHEPGNQHVWTRVLGSAAFGAVAMYVLDPDKGRRRRAIARDKAKSVMADARAAVGVTQRDVAHRVQGLRARARRLLGRRPTPDDLQLIERVRARMGRLVSHPHAIQVGALDGRITLSGPILAHEVEPLLESMRSVWGVTDVEERLVVHDRPESVPSLQGGSGPRKLRSEVTQEHWSPSARAAAIAGGTLLAWYGASRSTPAGSVLTLFGLGLAVRGATNRSLNRLVQRAIGRHGVEPDDALAPMSTDAREIARQTGGPAIYDATPATDQADRAALH